MIANAVLTIKFGIFSVFCIWYVLSLYGFVLSFSIGRHHYLEGAFFLSAFLSVTTSQTKRNIVEY